MILPLAGRGCNAAASGCHGQPKALAEQRRDLRQGDADVLQTSDALGAAAVQLGSQAVAWISVLNKHSTTHRPGGLYEP